MPYLLSQCVDGEVPRASYVSQEYSPVSGEVVVSDADYESKQGWVWDEANQGLRPATDADRLRWAKRDKEREIRDASEAEVNDKTRRNEADIVVHKSSTGATMSQPERDIRAIMQANHLKVVNLVGQVRNATTVEEVQAISWTPPPSAQVEALSQALEEADFTIKASRNRRKHRNPPAKPAPPNQPPTPAPNDPLTALAERVADIEAELDARTKVFE